WQRDQSWMQDALGLERFSGTQQWRMLAPDLKRLALGSGATDPGAASIRHTFYSARLCSGPDSPADDKAWRPVDAASVLNAMTCGAAWGCFQEDRRGRLMPGYQCDMTVLSLDPLHAEPSEVLKSRVKLV